MRYFLASISRNILLVYFAVMVGVASADEVPASPAQPESAFSSGPYCGVYCLHRALHALGQPAEIDALIDPKYIGSAQGSSLRELAQAADDFGVSTLAVNGLTADALQTSRHPILLHVAGNALSNSYNHWVLFLGMEGGRARIYDPPTMVTTVPLARLMSISDGVGLIVQPANAASQGLTGWSWRSMGIVFLGIALVIVHRAVHNSPLPQPIRLGSGRRFARLLRNTALLVAGGLFIGFVHDATNADGLFRNRPAVVGVAHKFFPDRFPETGLDTLREFVASGQGIVVDARMQSAYATGHLPGAVNIPVTSGLFGHRALLGETSTTIPICVYCQNDHCLWARDVAFRLSADGYEHVSVFSGGWAAWQGEENSHD